jgi:hypothetical protein
MTTDIFIRTYRKDIPWLAYCLKSIQKYCKDFRQVVIVIPKSDERFLADLNLTSEKVFTTDAFANDYLGQQATKLEAWKYSDADFICFTDSDCVFRKDTRPSDFIIGELPRVLKTPYANVGEAQCWKGLTETACKFEVEWEYMRRLPFTFRRDTLLAIKNWFEQLHGVDLYTYIERSKGFSEFNLMGAFAEKYESDKYTFMDTETNPLPPAHIAQFWSWGGLTPDVITEIEHILR